MLDAGAWGVMAPMMKTRADVELLVAACKYPPRGVRSLGSGRFAMSFKTDPQTYFQRADDEIMVIVQIEHADAIKNIDAMLSVPGVDACYVGPNDLMASMGLAPSLEPPHKEFEDAMQTVLRTAKKHGVAAGIHCATPGTVNRRIAEGWLMTGMVNDQRLLQSAAQAARAAVRNRLTTLHAMRVGAVVAAFPALPLAEYLAIARDVEARGYDTVWAGETAAATPSRS